MLKRSLFKFSVSNAFRRRGIAIFSICGTALGIALMVVLLSISDGMDARMNDVFTDLAGGVDVYPAGQMIPSAIGFPISYAEQIEGIEHVGTVQPAVLSFISSDYADFGDREGVTMRGVNVEEDVALGGATTHIIEGSTISADNEIILGSGLVSGGMRMGHGGGPGGIGLRRERGASRRRFIFVIICVWGTTGILRAGASCPESAGLTGERAGAVARAMVATDGQPAGSSRAARTDRRLSVFTAITPI